MNFRDFMSLAREYSNLGWAVQDQLDELLEGNDLVDLNPAALKQIRDLVAHAEKKGVDDSYGLKDNIDEHLKE